MISDKDREAIKTLCTNTETWWVVSAMRGPDCKSSYHFKDLTTAVVRYGVGIDSERTALRVVSPERAREQWKDMGETSRKEFLKAYDEERHFIEHFRLACHQLSSEMKSYECWLEDAVRVERTEMLKEEQNGN